jgi:hypothetical protein
MAILKDVTIGDEVMPMLGRVDAEVALIDAA